MTLYVDDGYVVYDYTQTGVSIDWLNRDIFVPKFYLNLIGGATYSLDTFQFKRDIDALMESELGMVNPDPIRHNPVVYLSGVPYARFVEIINGYTVTFEDGQYAVSLTGSNNNIVDVKTVNQVSLIPNNSAGLVDNTSIGDDNYAPTWDSVVGIVDAYQNNDAINISWGSASDRNEVFYNIYISTDEQLLFSGASLLMSTKGNSRTIRTEADGFTKLTSNIYYIGVNAVDIAGNYTINQNSLSVTFVPTVEGVLTTEQHNALMSIKTDTTDIKTKALTFKDLIVAGQL